MTLKAKLEREDFALAMILQDPILCPEFLRNTRDGAKDPNTWPQREFKYRWYQRDILSDKSPYVSLVGGRAIGKCQPATNTIYTENGYMRIGQLKGKQFYAWAWNVKENRFELRRAFCANNGERVIYDIETEFGYKMAGTMFHPVLTDKGWKNIEDIKVGDKVAIATKLPHVVGRSIPEHEARLLGYFLFKPFTSRNQAKNIHVFKHPAVLDDVKRNLGLLGAYYRDSPEGLIVHRLSTAIGKKRNRHPLTHLLHFYDFWYIRRYGWVGQWKSFRLHERMRRFTEENLIAFLGAIVAEYANVSAKEISIPVPSEVIAKDLQELFLRFGIETYIGQVEGAIKRGKTMVPSIVVTRDKRAVYRILTTFNLPNYRIGNIAPPEDDDPSYNHRFDTVVSTAKRGKLDTYAIQVEHEHTYISDNIIVHNSLVLEDRIIFDVLNNQETMVDTPEMVLTTANQAQMTPVIDKFNIRCLSSPLIRPFVKGGINRQKGTMDFEFNGRNVRLNARIAGMKGESNVIGLHIPRIKIDESQVYPLSSFRQLLPTLNTWEPNIQLFACGVPNGLTNSALYQVDQRMRRFKKYRVPATNNPFFTYQDWLQALRDYGGEEADLFQQLVLGRHGKGSEQVITRDDLDIQSYDFYSFRYSLQDKLKEKTYIDTLQRPIFGYSQYMAGIDTGFVDPTIIQVFGLKNGKWYLCARYKLSRIEFPEQELIIHWLHQHYNFTRILIDIGAGGGGATILQSLLVRPEYKSYRYKDVMEGVIFNEHVTVGFNERGEEIKSDTKSVGAAELVRLLQGKVIALSEIDSEGISQVERIVKQRTMAGQDRYFILSDQGKGQSKDDHIFSSFICFAMGIRDLSFLTKQKKKLGKTK